MELDNSNYSPSLVSSLSQYLSHNLYRSDLSTEAARCVLVVCCDCSSNEKWLVVLFGFGFGQVLFIKWKSGGDGSSQQIQRGGDISDCCSHVFAVLRILLTVFN